MSRIPLAPVSSRGIAETLALVDRLRQLAFDRSLAPDDALRRIRDTFAEHNDPEGSL